MSVVTAERTNVAPWRALLRSRKFWLAVFALVQSIVFGLWPNFPQPVWIAIDGIVGILIGAIAAEDAAAKAQIGRTFTIGQG